MEARYSQLTKADSLTPFNEFASPTDTLLEKDESPIQEQNNEKVCGDETQITVLLFSLLTGLFVIIVVLLHINNSLRSQLKITLLHSPASDAVEWRITEWAHVDDAEGEYVGEPTLAIERAWADIFDIMNVRLSKDDLIAVDRLHGAVALPDGSGYLGTLNVFHELHCIWWMYKYIHQDYFLPNITKQQREIMRYHSHHCLNHLRKTAMCHGDVGLVTYHWNPDALKPGATGTAHQCVDWDGIMIWSRNRAVNMTKPGYLVHPTLGQVFSGVDEPALGEPPHGIPPHD